VIDNFDRSEVARTRELLISRKILSIKGNSDIRELIEKEEEKE